MSEIYKIGQIRQLDEDLECVSAITKEKIKIYPKGTEFTVSASGFFIFPDGKMILAPKDGEIKGYDIKAIAHRIMQYLKRDTIINEVIDKDDDYCNERVYREVIEEALDDIL